MMICPVCQGTMQFWIGMPIDAKKDVPTPFGDVVRCDGCGLGMAARMPHERLARRGLARDARRHSWLRSLGLLARSALTVPHRKYDSIGILTGLASMGVAIMGVRGRG